MDLKVADLNSKRDGDTNFFYSSITKQIVKYSLQEQLIVLQKRVQKSLNDSATDELKISDLLRALFSESVQVSNYCVY